MKYILLIICCICSYIYIQNDVYAVTVQKSTTNLLMANGGDGKTSDIQVAGAGTYQKDDLIVVIKSAINRVLGLLALIALCILLRGGFQMVTAAGDDGKFKNGMTYLTQAGTGLIYIGVAWFMVSIIFYVIKLVTT